MYRPFKSYDKRWGHRTCFNLWASSPWCSGSEAAKGRRSCNYVSGIWILPPIPLWLPIDLAVRFSPIGTNVNKHCKHMPRVMMSLLMSPLPMSILHRLFRCRYLNSRDVVASSPSFSRPATNLVPRVLSYPSLQSERERERPWLGLACGSRTKVIMTEVSLVSQFRVSFTQWLQVSARAR